MTPHFFASALLTFFFVSLNSVYADDASDSQVNPGAQFCARIEELLKSLKQTDYQHTTEIDTKKGIVNCDCSGLVGYFLRHQFPEAYVSLKGDEAAWRKRPVSVTYYQTFMAAGENAEGPWRRVTKLMDAVPGDILAWRKKTLKAGSTTGHTCIIAGKPEIVSDGKVRVRIIDSTRSPHADDTRPDGKTGMGAGYKTFLVDTNGKCIGYLVRQRIVHSKVAVGRVINARSVTSHSDDAEFFGLTTSQATKLAKQRERSCRIIRQEGTPRTLKWLIKNERLNFVIEDNKVIRVLRG